MIIDAGNAPLRSTIDPIEYIRYDALVRASDAAPANVSSFEVALLIMPIEDMQSDELATLATLTGREILYYMEEWHEGTTY